MNTPDAKLLQVEAVADLPVIWNVLQRLDLVATLDRLSPPAGPLASRHYPGRTPRRRVAPTELVNQQGLLQFGHSKDNPTRPQLKIATAVLDPFGMPMSTRVVPGNTADDPLYLPLIQELQQSVGVGGKLYVGDCKMGAVKTRQTIASTQDFY